MLSVILTGVFLLASCNNPPKNIPSNNYLFKDAFNEILEMDKKYNTSFYTEALDVENAFSDTKIYYFDWNRTIISEEHIGSYITGLENLERKYAEADSPDIIPISIIIDAREQMLEAERLYRQGLAIIERGNAMAGFSCKDAPYITDLSYYYNQSSLVGQNVSFLLDGLLTNYFVSREFLTGLKRPKFYDSPFWPIRKFAIKNLLTAEQLCKIE